MAQLIAIHAFQEKSRHGIATPKPDVDLIKQRYRQAVEMEEEA
jgi:phage-related protein